jgi:ribosomal-protein-alanine N-acetyltransferase
LKPKLLNNTKTHDKMPPCGVNALYLKLPMLNEVKQQQQEILETERLILRPFTLQDAKHVQQLAGDKDIADGTCYIPHPYENGMAEKWIIEHRAACERNEQVVFAITTKQINDPIGAVGLMLHKEELQAELGYWIGKPYWGQGFATEAAQIMIKYGFEKFHLTCIYADCFQWNTASIKIIQKIGMRWKKSFDKYVERRNVIERVNQYIITPADKQGCFCGY